MELLDKNTVEYLKDNKDLITQELLDELRTSKEGKQLAIDILETDKDDEEYFLDAFGNRMSFNGNRQIKKAYSKMNLSKIHYTELERCAQDIDYFKNNYVKIKTPKGVGFPDLRPYQDKFVNELNTLNENYVVLFPRQSGKSITTAIYLTHVILFMKDIITGICANKAGMAREFLQNIKSIYELLPIWMQQGVKTWNKSNIATENNCRILTDATSGNSFRGFTCNIVVVDECIHGSSICTFRDKRNGLVFNSQVDVINNNFFSQKQLTKREVLQNILKISAGTNICAIKLYDEVLKLNPSLLFLGFTQKRLVFFKDGFKYSILGKNPLKYSNVPDELELTYNNGLCRAKKINILSKAREGAYDNFTYINGKAVIYDEDCFVNDVIVERNGNEIVAYDSKGSRTSHLYAKPGFFKNEHLEVLTSNGFKNFTGIKCTKKEESIKITLDNDEFIQCTLDHKFYVHDSFVYAKDLKINDEVLYSEIGEQNQRYVKIKDIEYLKEDDFFYDLIDVEDGHHFTANGIEVSNCAYIPTNRWFEFTDGILPSQSSLPWKKTIFLSTPNGMNHFEEIVQGARKHKLVFDVTDEEIENYPKESIKNVLKNSNGTKTLELNEPSNGYKLVSVDWREVPRYNSKGEKLDPEVFREQVIQKNGLVFFNQAYGMEFIGSSYTILSGATMKDLKSVQPIDKLFIPSTDQAVNVYEYPVERHKYICSIDPAKDGQDFFGMHILDVTEFPFKQVASGRLQVDYLLMPSFINDLALQYNTAFVIVENNEGAGQSIADTLFRDFEYSNMYFDRSGNKFKKYPGFRTTSKSRNQILKVFKSLAENRKLIINDKDTIQELQRFILINNKFQADDGFHDDLVMSLALAFAMFTNIENFNDMRDVVNNLYSENENFDLFENMNIGFFDDGPIEEDYSNKPNMYDVTFTNRY